MQQLMVWSLVLIILAGCGASTNVIETPEAIHVRWLAAIRNNDRAAALALVSVEMTEREIFVDQTLQTMQDLMTAPSSPTGGLIVIETRTPIDHSQGKRVISVWHFAKKTWCYATDLTASTDYDIGLICESVLRRQRSLTMDQRQPHDLAALVEAGDVERALVEQVAIGGAVGAIPGLRRHELVDVLHA